MSAEAETRFQGRPRRSGYRAARSPASWAARAWAMRRQATAARFSLQQLHQVVGRFLRFHIRQAADDLALGGGVVLLASEIDRGFGVALRVPAVHDGPLHSGIGFRSV